MYCVNKVVGWVASPLGLFFLGTVCGLALARARSRPSVRRLGHSLIVLSAAFLWLMATPFVNGLVGLPLEERTGGVCGVDVARLPTADAIVLLGGGVACHAECGMPELCQGADRVWTAAQLWKAGKAPVVAMTGGGVEKSTVPFLEALGVDAKALRCFPAARNTEEEARVVAASGVKRVLLVTSAWHMRRAKALFARAGLEVVPCGADWEMHMVAEAPIRFGDFFPSADVLARNSLAFKERIALVGYALR